MLSFVRVKLKAALPKVVSEAAESGWRKHLAVADPSHHIMGKVRNNAPCRQDPTSRIYWLEGDTT